jgi:hypothetical protein
MGYTQFRLQPKPALEISEMKWFLSINNKHEPASRSLPSSNNALWATRLEDGTVN